MKRFLLARINQIRYSKTIGLTGLAILVGVVTGAAIWLFKYLIEFTRSTLYGHVTGWLVVLIPLTGGLLVGLIAKYLINPEKFHGTANVMQAVALNGGRINYRQTPIKTLGAILSIGSGASLGPEDPSVQIGASFGSMFGQVFHMSEEKTSTMVAAGVASAIAAAFNAPIAGIFFALEIILGELSSASMVLILIAAVSSSVLTQAISGTSPAFQIPQYAFNSVNELPLYLLLGLLAGPISAVYIWLIQKSRLYVSLWHIPSFLKSAAAGLAVGLTGLAFPQILGVGYDTIGSVLNNNKLGIIFLFVLMLLKLILTPVSLAGGFFGGVFAPGLFIGAMLGGGMGEAASLLFPGMNIHPAAFALVGMAAVLAGTVRAPLTAILLLFEMTGDYRIILPLIFAVAVSLVISSKLQPDSVYEMGLAQHGIRLDRGRDIEVMSELKVSEIMETGVETLPESIESKTAGNILVKSRFNSLPVLDENGYLAGVLSLADIEGSEDTGIKKIYTRSIETVYPDESLHIALRHMSQRDLGMLPVVNRLNPRELLGVLRRKDIIHAYNVALTRRAAKQHRQEEVQLDSLTPSHVEVINCAVEEGAAIAGKRLREIAFPRNTVIASIRRGRIVTIPNGETEILPGDVLVIVTRTDIKNAVLDMCIHNQGNAA
jgi:CIC family chloride channel protein